MRSRPPAWRWSLPLLAALLGLVLLQSCPRLPVAAEYAGLLAIGALALAMAAWRRSAIWLAVALLPLALVQSAWRAELRLRDALPPGWEGRDILVTGRVDSLPSRAVGQGGASGWRFAFAVDSVQAEALPGDAPLVVPSRLSLSVYDTPRQAAPKVVAGERWQWLVRLKRPHGLRNPGGFDGEAWLFGQGLRATGSVRPGPRTRLDAARWWSVDAWRQALRERLEGHVADARVSGVLAALTLGDQAAIGANDWALFRRTGLAHLLSVSGTHVTMFAWLAQWLAGRGWRRSEAACLALPAPTAARWLGVLAALAYALFSGWGVPAQRTVWMLVTLAALRQLGLRWPWPLALLLAAFVVTAIDPLAVAQAGFWLSFVAVGLLMSGATGEPGVRGWRAWLGEGLRAQWIATLGLAPLGLLFFGQVSLVGLLANAVAIPLVTFVIVPLAMLGAAVPGLWWIAAQCVRGLFAYLQVIDGFSHSVWVVPAAPGWAQALALLGGVVLVLRLPWRLRACGLALCLPMLWPAPWRPAAGSFELIAADVGQGTAVLLRTAGHALVFDAGPQYVPHTPGADAGERVLVPLLRSLGVDQLDRLVLSHRDMDHVGGAAALLAGVPTRSLLSSLEDDNPLLQADAPRARCEAGQQWQWDDVRFAVLQPSAQAYGREKKSNALSCVLRVTAANGQAALLTGDIEAQQELALVRASDPGTLRAQLLMVPHHGSNTSSSEAFLDAVAPRLAVVQAGYRNRFGHPTARVMARYAQRGITVLTSADCGALRWRSDSARWTCERAESRRYWAFAPDAAIDGADDAAGEPD
ncbi:MAG: DNA internalization-related competence protein ComEC/Rec2 [Paucibacter sp.]|nr:DNA internalization-related competence protein ComEC/Rec2 [Roseateles sp.]